ncbi:Uncharacterised protein [uncultured archaeon]|nr:Uncharacterised protein [uncultured archaeon]
MATGKEDVELFKGILKSIGEIIASKHFEVKAELRGIKKAAVIDKLKDPKDLIAVKYQGYGEEGHKYGLLFKVMSNYDLKVVVSINGKVLNMVTVHVQNVKRRKRFLAWLEK